MGSESENGSGNMDKPLRLHNSNTMVLKSVKQNIPITYLCEQVVNDAIEDCVFDACIESDSADEMICNALSAFVQECQGGDVSGWREAENCRK